MSLASLLDRINANYDTMSKGIIILYMGYTSVLRYFLNDFRIQDNSINIFNVYITLLIECRVLRILLNNEK